MCDPVSATVAVVGALSIGTTVALSQQKPKMPPSPELPKEVMPSQMAPESKLPQVKLGTEGTDKTVLKREKRRQRLSLAGLDLSPEERPESLPWGAQRVRRF